MRRDMKPSVERDETTMTPLRSSGDATAARGRLTLCLGIVPGVATASQLAATILRIHRRRPPDKMAFLMVPNAESETQTRDLLRAQGFAGDLLFSSDVDDVLAVRPDVVVVEDILEANPSGSRHHYRYQDVEELRASGVSVWVAVSVTQLTMARDVVRRYTGILPRNTISDNFLSTAHDIEIIDVEPSELIDRRRQGEFRLRAVSAALFTLDALGALRDLAREVKRESTLREASPDQEAAPMLGVPATVGRILVVLTRAASPERLVRAGQRLADAAGIPWTVVFDEAAVRDGAMRRETDDETSVALRLAEALGAEIVALDGLERAERVMDYARAHQVTDIVIGRPRVRGIRRLFRRPLADRLADGSGDIAVHLIGDAAVGGERVMLTWRIDEDRPWFHEYVVGALAAFVAAGFIRITQSVVPPETLSIVMLMAVLYAATAYGLAAALFTSVLGVVLFNYFFLPPLHDFVITTPANVLLLAVFVVMAGITSNLAGRLHDQAVTARRRERNTAALFRLAREMATAPMEDVLKAVARQLDEILSVRSSLFLPTGAAITRREGAGKETRNEAVAPRAAEEGVELVYPPQMHLRSRDDEAVQWAFAEGRPAGPGTGMYDDACCVFWPLRSPRGVVGVLGLSGVRAEHMQDIQFRRRLESLAGLAAVAIERMMLSREIEEARFTARTESLRSALLSSISHDLRTPLASIIGSATSLLSFGRTYDESVRQDLLRTILEEAERLNRFVGNLLQMTKLESGAIAPKRQWIDADDLIDTTVERLERRLQGHRVVTDVTPLLPPLNVDFVLMENVLTNLLDNAVKYSPPGSTITLRAYQDGDNVCLEVSDEGVGIAKEDHTHVFDKFFRVYAKDSVVAGTGLGLAICKGIVETHGGTLELESPGLNQGTTFRICLPLQPLPQEYKPEGTEDA